MYVHTQHYVWPRKTVSSGAVLVPHIEWRMLNKLYLRHSAAAAHLSFSACASTSNALEWQLQPVLQFILLHNQIMQYADCGFSDCWAFVLSYKTVKINFEYMILWPKHGNYESDNHLSQHPDTVSINLGTHRVGCNQSMSTTSSEASRGSIRSCVCVQPVGVPR